MNENGIALPAIGPSCCRGAADCESKDPRRQPKPKPAKAEKRAEFEAGMQDIEAKRNDIVREFSEVDTQAVKAVDTFKEKVDQRIDKLEDRVDSLSKAL